MMGNDDLLAHVAWAMSLGLITKDEARQRYALLAPVPGPLLVRQLSLPELLVVTELDDGRVKVFGGAQWDLLAEDWEAMA